MNDHTPTRLESILRDNGYTALNAAFNAHHELVNALRTAIEILEDAKLVMDKDREENLNEWMPSIKQAIAKAEEGSNG